MTKRRRSIFRILPLAERKGPSSRSRAGKNNYFKLRRLDPNHTDIFIRGRLTGSLSRWKVLPDEPLSNHYKPGEKVMRFAFDFTQEPEEKPYTPAEKARMMIETMVNLTRPAIVNHFRRNGIRALVGISRNEALLRHIQSHFPADIHPEERDPYSRYARFITQVRRRENPAVPEKYHRGSMRLVIIPLDALVSIQKIPLRFRQEILDRFNEINQL